MYFRLEIHPFLVGGEHSQWYLGKNMRKRKSGEMRNKREEKK
jgi:hypothetical protein